MQSVDYYTYCKNNIHREAISRFPEAIVVNSSWFVRVTGQLNDGHVGHGSQSVTHCQLWVWEARSVNPCMNWRSIVIFVLFYPFTAGSVALLVARRTNDREVAGSRPTNVVYITVLTGNRMGVNCPLWPAASAL